MRISKKEHSEYFLRYIKLVKEDSILDFLEEGMDEIISFFEALPKEKVNYRYSYGKWSPKEILLHIIDTERVFQYRALRIAREPEAVLSGFDHVLWSKDYQADDRALVGILKNYRAVRQSTIELFTSFPEKSFAFIGIADNNPLSVRAAAFIIRGHELHHLRIIKERYL
ncbi:MAG TPA: damage-inducible protein DinB [Flavobacteriales bacterium]|jgi:hypothetical protein|nr:damage-inducible protein DinB [Flavobacteriales bacterium]